MDLAPGSMGPRAVSASCFVRAHHGGLAGIGRLQDARAILEGRAGKRIRHDVSWSARPGAPCSDYHRDVVADQSISART